MTNTKDKTRMLAIMGILTAITVALELFAGFVGIRFGPFNITLALAPTIIGAALYGWKAGAWLGFVFSFIVLFEPATALFMSVNAPATILVVLVKGTVAGLVAGAVYNAIAKKNKLAAVITAGLAAPIVNTGIFLLGCVAFFFNTVSELGAASGYDNAFAFLILGMVGLNFLVESAINLCLSTVIVRILSIVKLNGAKAA